MDDRKYDTNIQNTQLEHELQKLKKKLCQSTDGKKPSRTTVSENRGGKENGTK